MKLFVERKTSKNDFSYSVLGVETDFGDIVLTMKDKEILDLTDLRKSELVNLSERIYVSTEFDIIKEY